MVGGDAMLTVVPESTVPLHKFERVVERSKRRRAAIKQLQKALAVEKAAYTHLLQAHAALAKENYELREEKGTAWRKIHEYLRNQVNSSPWYWRLFGRV